MFAASLNITTCSVPLSTRKKNEEEKNDEILVFYSTDNLDIDLSVIWIFPRLNLLINRPPLIKEHC